ncbi:MAG TPA: dephospho-CoA kinase [Bacteroidales bacterium]|jgi:dephospho-CoA kinase|nr:dephospho-CoA kinase [Bacteroidales bacterium]HBA13186.1 dephospho-CoA kinase [Bacteroidales bacterium]
MVKIGITGGMGAGKSYVSALLALRGIPVYDSDFHAKRIMSDDGETVRLLTELVGPELYVNGKLDRNLMAGYIFADKENAKAVESIVHPKVRDDFRRWSSAQHDKDICVLESAILFESGFDSEVDFIVAVDAPPELRLSRSMARDPSVSESSLLARINSQSDHAEKCSKAGFVIINDGRDLESQIDKMLSICNNINTL